MQIDWWSLGLQTLNAIVLLWILSRFLFRPVADILKKRQEAAAAIMEKADAAKAAALASEEGAEAEAARLAAERSQVMEKALAEAGAAKEAVLADAHREAAKLRANAESAIEALKQKEMATVMAHAGDLAVDLAAKLLSRLPDGALVSGFIEGLGEAIVRLPEETKKEIGEDGETVRLKAVRALTPEERLACGAMLEKVLGRKVEFVTEADPALIAGLEFETPHALVKNSFRADLDLLQTKLTHHG
ncbi:MULTISPECIES: hypothetical protein [Alphaproteobacteria]|uniref:ATP synthase subunit b n=2 Tax=Alphaproteobacteria TaxID=28211 RepID=A0A512HL14_9HYPH|nr:MULTISPECIES: hypothetical protein [Alphaproteobacteria]GEO86131.1 ATP synthase subunit b [Ciceribacter naphthalenivorans]GLR22698.1 ATP synthase subunit b [Ciceribacter naphthalenivorans]GLT05554.1 ATP synthase subunit b [Sphingomonas psychrolutea]